MQDSRYATPLGVMSHRLKIAELDYPGCMHQFCIFHYKATTATVQVTRKLSRKMRDVSVNPAEPVSFSSRHFNKSVYFQYPVNTSHKVFDV